MEKVTAAWFANRAIDAWNGIKGAINGGCDALQNEELQRGAAFGFRAALVVTNDALGMAFSDAVYKGTVGYFFRVEPFFKFGWTRANILTNIIAGTARFGPMADRISGRIQEFAP